jgi:hypothetical protein
MYDRNEINEEMANDVVEHAAMGSIGNMHVDEDALVGSTECGYDRVDEKLDDDDYDEVANEHSRRMEIRMASMVIATTVVKVMLVALQLVVTLMQPLMAVEMVDLVIFPKKNEPRKLQTKE